MKKSLLVLVLVLAPFMVFGQSYSPGDTNHSSGIDIVDALLIAQAYVGLNPSNYYASEADVNCSGGVDVVDALLVAQYYVGLISSFPCESTPVPGTTTSISGGNITVRARGTMGGEILEIQVNGNTVASFTMSTSYADYSASGSGTVRTAFTNDDQLENGMDIQVDYIIIDGTTYQAEDQATNTAVYVDGACGGSYSEWLHCNGYIEFGNGGSTTTSTGSTTTSSGGNGNSHAFLLLGQSNMAGYPTAQASDKVQNSRILVLGYDSCSATGSQEGVWRVAVPPLHECYQGAIGPGDWFSKTIISRYPSNDTIRLIPCAISGEKIETFLKNGGSRYSWIISRAQAAQQAGAIIDGILFHQGESNNGQTDWPSKVSQLVSDLRADLGLGNVPFLAGELLYSGSCAGHNTLINQLPNVISNCRVISANGLVVDPSDTQWHLHFDHDSQVEFGKRYAQAMIELLGL